MRFHLLLLLLCALCANGQERHSELPEPPRGEALKALPPDGGPQYNRLVFELSPYLLQHATNPVDWYPWGEEAFQLAREKDLPIFLSIGYATCHWCHVMEQESFEDEEVAALLNKHFICIKVDREERPDIDEIYMTAVQLMTGAGGWPLTALLTPDLKPFFTGTYIPKNSRYGRMGMMEMLPRVAQAWTNQRNELETTAGKVLGALEQAGNTTQGAGMGPAQLTEAYQQLAARFDGTHGGFGTQPKFPTPHNLTFLLRYHQRSGDKQALTMVLKTLRAMRHGGLYDHVGKGFHRYSTDREWLVPHFEKMLYDQALLALAYLEAWQVSRDPFFADVAREIFDYVLSRMTHADGGFYSAEDADSEGEEGKFYFQCLDEVMAVLGPVEGALYAQVFNILAAGNFNDPSGPNPGHNIPHLTKDLAAWAVTLKLEPDVLKNRLEQARLKLFEAREKRVPPLKDDKVLTDWNGLMIAALARAGRVLEEPRYGRAAARAAAFIEKQLVDENGRLRKRFRAGKAGLDAHLDDYAFLIWGLIELHQNDQEVQHLAWASRLASDCINRFWDGTGGAFFLTAENKDLITRPKTIYDGALPSGNSVMALNLVRLSRLTANESYEETAHQIMRAYSTPLDGRASSATFLMHALDFFQGPAFEVVIVGEPGKADTVALHAALRRSYLPNMVVLQYSQDLLRLAPFLTAYSQRNDQATAYVCRNYACKLPTNQAAQMLKDLGVSSTR